MIYHNPVCGTSRNALAMIRQSGEEPTIIEYLKTPPSRETLVALLAAMKLAGRWFAGGKGAVVSVPKVLREAPWQIVLFSIGMYLVVYGGVVTRSWRTEVDRVEAL